MRTLRAQAVAAGLFLLAFGVRILPAPRVFDGDSVHLFGTDAYYHLRRVLFSLEHFPEVLHFDRYINHPYGGEPIWPPLFDGLLALLALPVYTGADPANAVRVEALLVWVPPLLGAGAVWVTYAMTRRLFDATTAWVTGVVLAFLSGHYWYSQIGFVDHHAAIAFLGVCLLAVATRLMSGESIRLGWAAATGALFAAMIGVWPGALLHVGIVEGALLCLFATRATREAARSAAVASVVANAVAAVLVAPLTLGNQWTNWSAFSPAVATGFQPWLFSALAVHAAACAALWRSDWGEFRTGRIAQACALGVGVVALSVSFFPDLLAGIADAWRWLFKEELFQAAVAESKPLFLGQGGFDRTVAEARLSRFVYLLPPALIALVVSTWDSKHRRAVWLLVFQAGVLAAVTLLQRRFFNSLSLMVALTMGWALVEIARRGSTRTRVATRLGAAALALWLMVPVLQSYRLPLRNVGEALRGQSITLPEAVRRRRAFARAANWLRENSPPTAGFLDPTEAPAYGVLALWTHGHLIEYVARRPSIANNFGDDLGGTNLLASYRYFDAPLDEAAELIRHLGVRYVFMRTFTAADRKALPRDSMRYALSAPTDELRDDSNRTGLRLVYDEPLRLPRDRGRIRIFEAP